jgi:hypothetical protein
VEVRDEAGEPVRDLRLRVGCTLLPRCVRKRVPFRERRQALLELVELLRVRGGGLSLALDALLEVVEASGDDRNEAESESEMNWENRRSDATRSDPDFPARPLSTELRSSRSVDVRTNSLGQGRPSYKRHTEEDDQLCPLSPGPIERTWKRHSGSRASHAFWMASIRAARCAN